MIVYHQLYILYLMELKNELFMNYTNKLLIKILNFIFKQSYLNGRTIFKSTLFG
jgi:hypothetical protein